MYVTTVVFIIMCLFYKYVEPKSNSPSTSVDDLNDNENEKEILASNVGNEEAGVVVKSAEAGVVVKSAEAEDNKSVASVRKDDNTTF